MFDYFVERYKEACIVRQLKTIDWIQLILLCISFVVSLIFSFIGNICFVVGGLVVSVLDLAWIVKRSKKEQREYSEIQKYNMRVENIQKILVECKLYDKDSIDWLLKTSESRLEREPQQEYMKTFASAIAGPILLGAVATIEDKMNLYNIICLSVVIVVFSFVFYISMVLLESDLKDMTHAKYRRLEEMIEDLRYVALKSIKNENRNIHEK